MSLSVNYWNTLRPSEGISAPKSDWASENCKSSCCCSLLYMVISHFTVVTKAIKAINAIAFLNIFDKSCTTSDSQLKQIKIIQRFMDYYLWIWNERSNKLLLNYDNNVSGGSNKVFRYTMCPGESDHMIGAYLKLQKKNGFYSCSFLILTFKFFLI